MQKIIWLKKLLFCSSIIFLCFLACDKTGSSNGAGESITYSISGRVTHNGEGFDGVTITLTGRSSGSQTTDISGNYHFTGLSNGSYTLTPSSAYSEYLFKPISKTVWVSDANVNNVDFIAEKKAPILEDFKCLNEILEPNQLNNISLEVSFRNEGKSLLGGKLLTTVTQVYGPTTEIKLDLTESQFNNEIGTITKEIALNLGNCQAVDFSAILEDVEGTKSNQLMDSKFVEDITPLYDNFDGVGCHQYHNNTELATLGYLNPEIWEGNGEIVSKESSPFLFQSNGNVCKLSLSTNTNDFAYLNLLNPLPIEYSEFKSFSTDVFVSSSSTAEEFNIGITTHASIDTNIGDDDYWHANIAFEKSQGGFNITGYWKNMASGEYPWQSIQADFDTWYNLRIYIKLIDEKRFQIFFYVNNELLLSGITEESEILLDPDRTDWGPGRQLYVWSASNEGDVVVYFDNVKAVYEKPNYVPNEIPFYDDFDGHGGEQSDGRQLAISGQLSNELWDIVSDKLEVIQASEVMDETEAGGHGYILKMKDDYISPGGGLLSLIPYFISYSDFKSISFDIYIPSEFKGKEFSAGFDLHGAGRFASWYSQILIKNEEEGYVYPAANMKEAGGGTYHVWESMGIISFDKWYNLRMDCVEDGEYLRFDFYINDSLRFSETPPLYGYGGPNKSYNPRRQFGVDGGDPVYGDIFIYIDNVRAIYNKK